METAHSTAQKQIDRLSQGAHQAVDRAAQTAAAVAERLGEKGEELAAVKEDWVEGAREYVREHPIAALGIAAAAGVLLSMLMRR